MKTRPNISIYNDHDMKHYVFMRDSKTPRGSFGHDWEGIGHKYAPIVAVAAILVALIVLAVT
jgi:hypothetical protein